MARETHRHESQKPTDRATDRRLAFSVFAPPVAWFGHEIIGVSVVGRHCAAADQLTGTQWSILVATAVIAALIAITAGLTAYRIFTRKTDAPSVSEAEGWGRVEFVALFGIFVSGFLLLNIIYFGVMPFVVDPCMRAN